MTPGDDRVGGRPDRPLTGTGALIMGNLGQWKGNYVTYRWLVLWVQFQVEAILFLLILKPLNVNFVQKCQIFVI